MLWGANGVVGRCFEPLTLWQAAAENVSGRAVNSGHYIAEEAPDEVLAEAGSIVDPQRPSPVTARHVVGQMLPDIAFTRGMEAEIGRAHV